ncbi:aspartate/glutamate racemase family protein [Pseudomonas sp.]|uniref:aspartate/glutamate racemase family protein n=1 Tax=Pseudomonas sp. TaxID=306 RepID=UPI0028A86D05|nr:aspartate/glutamate racemase family protein [Pseudomonas sp.]
MRTLGLLAGMSWESSVTYYRLLNQIARQRLGGLHSAPLLMWSVDFAKVAELQHHGDWDGCARLLVDAARRLETAGAEGLLICTNTMHKLAEPIQAAINIPLIHIADATAKALTKAGMQRPALLATRFTMEQDFYVGHLRAHGLDPRIPDAPGRERVHQIIYEELCQGVVRNESRQTYVAEIGKLADQGADSVILGCTEIGLLLSQKDLALPVFDTTEIHAEAAMDFALGNETLP